MEDGGELGREHWPKSGQNGVCSPEKEQICEKKKRIGAKAIKEHDMLENTSNVLNAEQATCYRALAARANYVAQDRPDAAFAAKEQCRSFAQPTSSDVLALCTRVRMLQGVPVRVAQRLEACSFWATNSSSN